MKQKKSLVTFTLRLPRDFAGQIQQHAEAVRMSMNAWVLRAIDMALVSAHDTLPSGQIAQRSAEQATQSTEGVLK